MNWQALSPLQIAGVWAALAALALWLYLHHRRPQHRKVSTLRFWASVQPVSQPRRRQLREPWALLAQVLFLLLLVLALANPRWGAVFEGRTVVIVFDASIWSQAHPAGGTSWIDRERAEALRLVDSLPSNDRVLLLRAEADAPPILPFTADHAALRRAIENAQPSSGVADIPRALEMGKAALAGSRRGLLAYVGPGMLDNEQARHLEEFRAALEAPSDSSVPPQFLVRLADDRATLENRGITRLSLRRDTAQPDRWHLLTQLKNYGDAKADAVLKLSVNGQPLGQRQISLAPRELANTENEFVWDQGGLLQAEIGPSDELDADNRAVVSLPTFRTVRVAVFANPSSPFAANLLSVLSSNPYAQAQIFSPEMAASVSPDVAIYRGTSLPAEIASNSIWFLSGPSAANSRSMRVTRWSSQHPVTRWVRTQDVSVHNTATLTPLPNDTVLAYTDENPPAPLILAREQNGRRILIVGFDPQDSNFPQESAFPLFMAGGMEWMTHSVEEAADSLSTGELDVAGPVTRIVSPSGRDVAFARKGSDAHLLALETGTYRVVGPGGESSLAVNAPLLPEQQMKVAPAETAGVEGEPLPPVSWDLWRWLVLLAIVALWLEWWLYYSSRERQRNAEIRETPASDALQKSDLELEEREESELRNPKVPSGISYR
ncbi:MAG: VWA domain-containing protein [Acidobacteriia bacterium]|nr:VWA domain-containing protein [Terriglobia bacterium]